MYLVFASHLMLILFKNVQYNLEKVKNYVNEMENIRSEISTILKIHALIWVMAPCSLIAGEPCTGLHGIITRGTAKWRYHLHVSTLIR
jgi:hypothetical protein